MNVSEAKWENGALKLRIPYSECFQWLGKFKPGQYDLVRQREKRSTTANAYAWALMTRIGEKLRLPAEEVYRKEIKYVSGRTEIVRVKNEAAEAFRRTFCNGFIGRYAEKIGQDEAWTEILLTYGSSDYDRKQMAEFIDAIIEDCRNLDIEYDDGKARSLLEAME